MYAAVIIGPFNSLINPVVLTLFRPLEQKLYISVWLYVKKN